MSGWLAAEALIPPSMPGIRRSSFLVYTQLHTETEPQSSTETEPQSSPSASLLPGQRPQLPGWASVYLSLSLLRRSTSV